jgi:hypothetical protein
LKAGGPAKAFWTVTTGTVTVGWGIGKTVHWRQKSAPVPVL